MFPSFHFFSGIILAKILGVLGFQFNFWLFVLLGVALDLDIFLLPKEHRHSFIHTPFFWGIITLVALGFNFWVYMFPIWMHFGFDSLTYGLRWKYPWNKNLKGFNWLKGHKDWKLLHYLHHYWTTKWILLLEATTFICAVVSWFLL